MMDTMTMTLNFYDTIFQNINIQIFYTLVYVENKEWKIDCIILEKSYRILDDDNNDHENDNLDLYGPLELKRLREGNILL